jgi:hypothetical protein
MKVNIGEGKKKGIKFWRGDDAFEKAKGFCKRFKLEEGAAEFLAQLLEKRKAESLKKLNAPNALVSNIAFPDQPVDDVDYARSNGISSGVMGDAGTGFGDIEDNDELHGSQTLKFRSLVERKMMEDEEEEEESVLSEIDDKELLINNGLKIHMKGLKLHEKEIKKVVKKKRQAEKEKKVEYTFKPKLNKNSIKIVQVRELVIFSKRVT